MGDVAVNANQIPATVEVVCGNLRGTYDVAKAKVLYLSHLGGIREATPTEFERLGGRQATKKWKQASLVTRQLLEDCLLTADICPALVTWAVCSGTQPLHLCSISTCAHVATCKFSIASVRLLSSDAACPMGLTSPSLSAQQSIRVVDTHGQPGKSLGEWLAGTAGTANEGTRAVWLAMGSAPQSGGHAQEPPARAQVGALHVPSPPEHGPECSSQNPRPRPCLLGFRRSGS